MRHSLWTASPQDSLCLLMVAGFSHNDGLRECSGRWLVEGAVFCDLIEELIVTYALFYWFFC